MKRVHKLNKEESYAIAVTMMEEIGFKDGKDFERVTWDGIPRLAFTPQAAERISTLVERGITAWVKNMPGADVTQGRNNFLKGNLDA